MKIRIELNEHEIKSALQKAIQDKVEGLKLDWSEVRFLQLDGSVKFKKKSVRKTVERYSASVTVNRL